MDDLKYILKNGGYIAIDGPDGSGKTTLVNYISEIDSSVIKISEPDRSSSFWPIIRDYRLSGEYPDELWVNILVAASLEMRIKDGGIYEMQNQGKIVVSDRSPMTFLALYWGRVSAKCLESKIKLFKKPDRLFVLIPEDFKILRDRMKLRGDNYNDIEDGMKLAKNYLIVVEWLKSNFNWPVKIVYFNSSHTVENVYKKLLDSF